MSYDRPVWKKEDVNIHYGVPFNFEELSLTAYVFDDFIKEDFLIKDLQKSLRTVPWRFENKVTEQDGTYRHRLWGCRLHGPELTPPFMRLIKEIDQRAGVRIPDPDYIGMNGQTINMNASTHIDCPIDLSGKHLSVLYYIGEDDVEGGALNLWSDMESSELIHSIEFKPNRLIMFDGSIPHNAEAPTNNTLRASLIYRGNMIKA